ncbi:MAG: ferredoxin family protein [Pirellulaceae bacterium]|jgi:hypothetical protein|nr:ferredoxin family protein [Pirellulaceae bacterium]
MAKRIAVVISQGQSNNPAKRQLEEDLVTTLMFETGIDVTVIPNLYDLRGDGTGMLALQGIKGDMIVVSWLFPRAAHWTLDRNGIRGHVGASQLRTAGEDDDSDALEESGDKPRVADDLEIPDRTIYCVPLRASDSVADFVDEIKRIHHENSVQVMQIDLGGATAEQRARFENPTNDTALPLDNSSGNGREQHRGSGEANGSGNGSARATTSRGPAEPQRNEAEAGRRWYPVIDFSRCTNCMECVDFCLFGVYGVDVAETILVEQPDNCRKGCPACSRVCPENAIMFPQHKTPNIAGATDSSGSMKIDLSLLFGSPDAVDVAGQERDEQLLLAGRDALAVPVHAQREEADAEEEKDELDELIDELDQMDL